MTACHVFLDGNVLSEVMFLIQFYPSESGNHFSDPLRAHSFFSQSRSSLSKSIFTHPLLNMKIDLLLIKLPKDID